MVCIKIELITFFFICYQSSHCLQPDKIDKHTWIVQLINWDRIRFCKLTSQIIHPHWEHLGKSFLDNKSLYLILFEWTINLHYVDIIQYSEYYLKDMMVVGLPQQQKNNPINLTNSPNSSRFVFVLFFNDCQLML